MIYRLFMFIVLSLIITACGGNAAPADVPPATNTTVIEEATQTPTEEATIEPSATSVPAQAVAPDADCPEFVETALNDMENLCNTTGRNQACYGNSNLLVSPQANVESLQFDSPGDIANVTDIQSIKLSALDTATEVWGIALLRLQANLPDTNPGQNVTFLLFGDVELENRSTAGTASIQSFYFNSGIGDSACNSAPESGMLIQTPEGVGKIDLLINEVNINLGSTAYLQAEADSDFFINVVEGEAIVTSQGISETVPAGTRTAVKLDANGLASSPPSPPEPYQVAPLRRLPVSHLERPVRIHEFVDTVTAAPIGFEVSDSLSAAGESDIFTFDGIAGQIIYLDGIANEGDFSWELQSADGTSIKHSVRISFDMDLVSLPESGTYQIVVKSSSGTETGTYSFKVWDVPPDEELQLSLPADAPAQFFGSGSGAIETPGSRDIYKFTVEDYQTLYFDGVDLDGTLQWFVIDTSGVEIDSELRLSFDMENVSFEQGGEYILVVDGISDAVGTYSFNIWNIPPNDELTLSLPADAPENLIGSGSGAIETPGTQDYFRFNASAGQRLYFDGLESEVTAQWFVYDPNGEQIDYELRVVFDMEDVQIPVTGEYVLSISGLSESTGTYSFNIWDVPPPDQLELTIPADAPPQLIGAGSGTIETPGVQDWYTFPVTAGQTLYFDGLDTRGSLQWTIVNAEGEEVANELRVQFDMENVSFDTAGEYTLIIDGLAETVGDYAFHIINVPQEGQSSSSVVPDDAPAQLLGKAEGNIASAGLQDSYPFTVSAGQSIYFDGISADDGIQWQVLDADGNRISSAYSVQYDHETISFDTAGDYTILVEGASSASGAYAFQYWNIPAPDELSLSLPDNAPERLMGTGAGAIESPGVQDIYRLNIAAGQTIYFDGLESDGQVHWQVFDADGNSLSSAYDVRYDLENITFEQAGDYQLIISGYADALGTYAFQLWDVPPPERLELIRNEDDLPQLIGTASGELFSPGTKHIYEFTVNAGERLYFDGISGDTVTWQIYNPATNANMSSAYQVQYDLEDLIFETAGNYQVIVFGYQDAFGPYEFRIWQAISNTDLPLTIPDDAPPNLLGSISGTIVAPGQIDYYLFNLEQDQTVYLDGFEGTVYLYWDLLDMDVNQILGNSAVIFDLEKFTSETDASYQIRVQSINGEVGDYEFKIWNVLDAQEYSLSIGDTISGTSGEGIGNIESPGAEDVYSFSVDGAQMLEFEGIEAPLFLLWRVEDAQGNEIIASNNVQFDIPPDLFESGGDYRLIVSGQEDEYGLYSFQIRTAEGE